MACNDDGAGKTRGFHHNEGFCNQDAFRPPLPMWKSRGESKLSKDQSLSSASGVDNNGYVDAVENRDIRRSYDRWNESLHCQTKWHISRRYDEWHLCWYRRHPAARLTEGGRAHHVRSGNGSATICYQAGWRRNNVSSEGYHLEGQGHISLCTPRHSLEWSR